MNWRWGLLGGMVTVAVAVAGSAALVQHQMNAALPIDAPRTFEIQSGDSVSTVQRRLRQQGLLPVHRLVWALWVRWQRPVVRAGEYQLLPGDSTRSVLQRFRAGKVLLRQVTIVEGTRFRDLLTILRGTRRLHFDLDGLPGDAIMARLGYPGVHPEGRFFPDTYAYSADSQAFGLLRQAADQMDRELQQAWEQRAPDLPLTSPNELLVLASIVEKETGLDADRGRIAGIFVRRLQRGMRLQTDPTVIYGLGDAFDGNLTRDHLRTDQPWNTYTRAGLPPSPICLPGRASLRAAAAPEVTGDLYFVARGDGTTEFSPTLRQHQAAVRKFQINRRRGEN